MNNFVIYTDSACDIKPEVLLEWGVKYSSLSFRFTSSEKEYIDADMPASEFYQKMRDGEVAKTAAVNPDTFVEEFKKILDSGDDILCISFSSGLSTTYNSARIAAEGLRGEYPERRIEVIDSLAASAGLGLLVYLATEKKNSGASLDEVKTYIEELIPRMGIWFTVDDLVYLKRGGRISSTAAFVGNMLGIKPVLYMDNEGHLINRAKVRGRRTAITSLADKFGELASSKTDGAVFISHGDCIDDAKALEKILAERYGATVKVITDVGPVIGSHSGPGTLALFFIADHR
jgi:DegV family protein with EDD domain